MAKTLCDMAKDKVRLKDWRPLVAGAKYICKGCGRVSSKKKKVCKPKII